jgi:hypothetical protein
MVAEGTSVANQVLLDSDSMMQLWYLLILFMYDINQIRKDGFNIFLSK